MKQYRNSWQSLAERKRISALKAGSGAFGGENIEMRCLRG